MKYQIQGLMPGISDASLTSFVLLWLAKAFVHLEFGFLVKC